MTKLQENRKKLREEVAEANWNAQRAAAAANRSF